MARYLVIYKEYQDALKILRVLKNTGHGTMESCFLEVFCLTKLDQPEQKIMLLQKSIDFFGHDPYMINELAVTYEIFDDSKESIALYLKALKRDKYNDQSLNLLAAQVFYLGSSELSTILYTKLIGNFFSLNKNNKRILSFSNNLIKAFKIF